ncbi:hypothetical protein FDG2_0319 [Candidatus Protofrankia californiensis]|uniref:Uncharacterized protein n=1 Tax=Candidatus Protofrankia californiensis TaxID=1839754 RepID=A0A1C3NTB3_9ACTN|nr:hypothetical protein FDG2_0319 [Candidatus Protofrankia californiensis]
MSTKNSDKLAMIFSVAGARQRMPPLTRPRLVTRPTR